MENNIQEMGALQPTIDKELSVENRIEIIEEGIRKELIKLGRMANGGCVLY